MSAKTRYRKDFTGAALNDLVVDIEMAIGKHLAGTTKLGHAVTEMCEKAVEEYKEKERAVRAKFLRIS